VTAKSPARLRCRPKPGGLQCFALHCHSEPRARNLGRAKGATPIALLGMTMASG
jgi:hypothetical protein